MKSESVTSCSPNDGVFASGYVQMLAPQGWQCPVCKMIYSPVITSCNCCAKPVTTAGTTTSATTGVYSKGDSK